MGAITGVIKKIGKFLVSKPFLIGLAVLLLILLCILFWIYSPLVAFNDIHIFGNSFLRAFIIFIVWLSIVLIFAFKKFKDILNVFKNIEKSSDFGIEIMETDKDHIHMLVRYPPNISVSSIVRRLKQCSTLSLWKQFSVMLAKQFWKEHTFWTDGYFACSVGNVSEEMLREYIENQG